MMIGTSWEVMQME